MTKGPDLTEFVQLSLRKRRAACQVALAASQLTQDEQAQIAGACSDTERISTGAIVEWLAKRGYDVSIPAVTAHRRAKCGCHER